MTTTELIPTYPSIEQLAEHLSLRSLSSRTHEEYVRYIRKLAGHCAKDPATLEEHEARAYLLYLKEQKQYAPSSMRIATAALRFFYNEVLGRGWRLLSMVRSPDKQRLPIVLSREEVRRIIGVLQEERFRVVLQLIYSCGLRVGEAVSLQVTGHPQRAASAPHSGSQGRQRPLCAARRGDVSSAARVLEEPPPSQAALSGSRTRLA